MVKFLRRTVIASVILLLFRLYLGYEWFQSGWGKFTGSGFDAGGFIKGAIGNATGEHPAVPSWWANFLEGFALPNVGIFNTLIPWGEVLVGSALVLGLFTTFAALMGITMNFAFLFSGTTSINPQMVLLTIFILVAGANAGRFGIDRYISPNFKKMMNKEPVID